MPGTAIGDSSAGDIDGPYAWLRLAVIVLLATIGGVGMWAVVVVLPAVQAEFGVDRADASLPYTATMIGFALGNVFIGRAIDRIGYWRPALIASIALGAGFLLASRTTSIVQFAAGARRADRRRLVGDLRSADRRHFALVRAPARRRRFDRRGRQLPGRRVLADRHALCDAGSKAGASPMRRSASSAWWSWCRWC